ncbi:MAG TPA: amino acid permease [Planctomycetaceae bacterium]|jgi:amino acid transporter|nr:amino acid permease [Planctomycetaceae bacterium]
MDPPSDPTRIQTDNRPAELGLWDAVSVIVGIVVGVSIFQVPPTVFSNVGTAWQGIAVWAVGGLVALVGALCYGELATTYSGSGGDYIYLNQAYGPLAGFLFAWTRLTTILTGNIAAMSYVFADYAVRLFGCDARAAVWFAVSAVVVVTLFNVLGLKAGKSLQNLLSMAKVLGLAALLATGLWKGSASSWQTSQPVGGPGVGLAMILVLFAYGGWNDAALVTADVHEPRRNMPRALILGTLFVTAVYVLVNIAYVHALGFAGVRDSQAPAADVLALWPGGHGAAGMSLLVMVSALGAVSGLVLTGSRLHARLGGDYRIFSWMGRWNPRFGSPVRSLMTQAAVSLLLIVGVGTDAGRASVDRGLTTIGLSELPWAEYRGGFNTLVAGTSPVFWLFFLLTGVSLLVLRRTDRGRPRPFTTPLYPFVPLIFITACGYMLYASVVYARALCLLGVVPLLVGIPLFLISGRRPVTEVDS